MRSLRPKPTNFIKMAVSKEKCIGSLRFKGSHVVLLSKSNMSSDVSRNIKVAARTSLQPLFHSCVSSITHSKKDKIIIIQSLNRSEQNVSSILFRLHLLCCPCLSLICCYVSRLLCSVWKCQWQTQSKDLNIVSHLIPYIMYPHISRSSPSNHLALPKATA